MTQYITLPSQRATLPPSEVIPQKVTFEGASKLTFATLFYYEGVHIAPCKPGSKEFLPSFGPHKKYLTDDLDLLHFFQEQDFNYALLTGTGRGEYRLVVIDFDDLTVYEAWRNQVGSVGDTFTVSSFRGRHVYFWSLDKRSWRVQGAEIKGANQAIMGPLSMHPEGVPYMPLNRPKIQRVETLADMPLLDRRPDLPPPPGQRPVHLGGGLLQQLKDAHPILQVIQARPELAQKIRLKTSDQGKGRWYTGFCPWHDDKHPSFWVDAERNTWGCRACDARGDVLNLIARVEGVDIADLIRDLTGKL